MRRSGTHTRSLIVFLGASLAAHAAAFGVFAGYTRATAVPPVVIEVTLQQPVPAPVTPREHEFLPRNEEPEPPRNAQASPTASQPSAQAGQPAPLLSLPAPQAPAARAFTAPAQPEQRPVPEQKAQVASIAMTLPVYGAAYLGNPPPAYPAPARRNGVQGTVMLKVLVTRDGLAARVELEQSSGSTHLDNAALEAVKAWRFAPARRGSEPIEGIVTFPIVFRLEGGAS